MHVVLFGASGAMGQAVARRFLTVYPHSTLVLYVRNSDRVPVDVVKHRSTILIEGQLDDLDDISKALEGNVDAVITALGPTGRKGPLYPGNRPIATAYSRIIKAMKEHGVRRLIALTTPSVRDPDDQFHLPLVFLRTTFATLARNVVKDIIAVGDTVRTEGAELEWTLIRLALHTRERSPAVDAVPVSLALEEGYGLGPGPGLSALGKGSVSMSLNSLPAAPLHADDMVIAGYMGDGRTRAFSSRAGAAAFIIDELEKREWVRKAPILSAL